MEKEKPKPETEMVECGDCKEKIAKSDSHFYEPDNIFLCSPCRDDNYFLCNGCENLNNNDNSNSCDDCDYQFCNDCWDGGYCDNCDRCFCSSCDSHYQDHDDQDNDSDRIPYRKVDTKTKQFQSNDYGKIIKSNRGFGVEIECYYPETSDIITLAKSQPKELGIAADGSLSDCGIELQTPILAGKAGEDFIKSLTDQLEKLKFDVDKSCGLHIHLSGNDIAESAENLRKLWLFYFAFDDVLLAMLPKTRRTNNYCLPLKRNYAIGSVLQATNLKAIEQLWYKTENEKEIEGAKKDHYNSSRYNGINFHCLLSEQHLEIRYHSGTTNFKKIMEWANLHARILDSVSEMDSYEIQKVAEILTLTEKVKAFFKMIELQPSSQSYLMARIKKFNPSLAEEKELCAE